MSTNNQLGCSCLLHRRRLENIGRSGKIRSSIQATLKSRDPARNVPELSPVPLNRFWGEPFDPNRQERLRLWKPRPQSRIVCSVPISLSAGFSESTALFRESCAPERADRRASSFHRCRVRKRDKMRVCEYSHRCTPSCADLGMCSATTAMSLLHARCGTIVPALIACMVRA